MVVTSPLLQEGQARALLKALSDPLRLQVIEALANGERCVCDLTADLGLAQSKLSFHLKVLKDAGLLADGSIPLSSKQGNGREWRGNQEESNP